MWCHGNDNGIYMCKCYGNCNGNGHGGFTSCKFLSRHITLVSSHVTLGSRHVTLVSRHVTLVSRHVTIVSRHVTSRHDSVTSRLCHETSRHVSMKLTLFSLCLQPITHIKAYFQLRDVTRKLMA